MKRLVVLCLLAGCAMPISVRPRDPGAVHRALTANELSTGEPSLASRIVLQRRGLLEAFENDPAATLATLHRECVGGRAGADELFALAELSFHHARNGGGRPHQLAAAVYAWSFLFPSAPDAPPDPYDPRMRLATDLYNRAITEAFEDPRHEVAFRDGSYELPFGSIRVTVDPSGFRWGSRELIRLVAVSDFEVRGFRNRYREPGIGAALAAGTRPIDPEAWDFVAPKIKVPVTALLRFGDPRRQLADGRLDATVELHAQSTTHDVQIGGRRVPLEIEPTSALAYSLEEANLWDREIKGLLSGAALSAEKRKSRLIALQPYRPGLIPVVFVHGTSSSPARWAEMANDLLNEPRIRDRFQLWAFIYDTGNPIVYSAMLLRQALRDAQEHLDPDGRDACLSRMVVIGHSQGGLLTKMTAIDSGDRLWRNVSDRPIDELSLKPETREVLREAMFIRPLPLVRRVVFLATPHRGSFQARTWVVNLLARAVTMPADVLGVGADLLALREKDPALANLARVPTAVENMSPSNRFIRTLSTIPISPEVKAHSIVAVDGDGPPETGNDGVVTYQSAHIEGVESELVVRSPHSVQGDPHAIEEVRRILLQHDAALVDGQDACRSGTVAP